MQTFSAKRAFYAENVCMMRAEKEGSNGLDQRGNGDEESDRVAEWVGIIEFVRHGTGKGNAFAFPDHVMTLGERQQKLAPSDPIKNQLRLWDVLAASVL